jgi:hypothetical protein
MSLDTDWRNATNVDILQGEGAEEFACGGYWEEMTLNIKVL